MSDLVNKFNSAKSRSEFYMMVQIKISSHAVSDGDMNG